MSEPVRTTHILAFAAIAGQLPLSLSAIVERPSPALLGAAGLAGLAAALFAMVGRASRRPGRAEETAQRAATVRSAAESASTQDPLTQALSRSGLLAEIRRAGPQAGIVAAIDVAGMKALNTRRGQAFGDRLLTALARRMSERIRPGDLLARWGGDEFVIVLPGVCRIEAARVIARLRHSLVEDPLPRPDQTSVDLTIGIAELNGAGEAALITAVREAEEEVHTAKQLRKARVA